MEQGTRNKEEPEELVARLEAETPAAARGALHVVESLCRQRGVALYLVGGAVRDLLLGRAQLDLDLAIEGEVAPVASALAATIAGKATLHERFGTAHVAGPGYALDLAQTRRETYAHPGALPTVEPVTSILDDLARRDFTINAMALRLTAPQELIDPFGGAADLGAGLVRVLHERSFQDDATRMLRAVRYATRLGFEIETVTQIWRQRDLDYLDAISGPRLRRELTLIFDEATFGAGSLSRPPAEPGGIRRASGTVGDAVAPEATLLAQRLGVLGRVHEKLHIEPEVTERWSRALASTRYAPIDELGFCLVVDPLTPDDVDSVTHRLHLTARVEKALRDLVRLRELSAKLARSADSPGGVVELLDGISKAAAWALSLLDRSPAGETATRYLSDWQHVKPSLTGNDLLALGVVPGERIGALLRRLRAARLTAEVSSREEEIALVQRELAGGAE